MTRNAAPPALLHELPPTFRFSQAMSAGMTEWQLRSSQEDGTIERIGRGLYRRADAPAADFDLLEIATRAPAATICLTSALSRHDLTDIIPARIDIALPRSQRPRDLHLPIAWHKFADDTFEIGRRTLQIERGISIGLYGPERSIIDAYRLRHQEGLELGREALRRWLRRRDATPSRLLQMARHFPLAAGQMRNDLELLL